MTIVTKRSAEALNVSHTQREFDRLSSERSTRTCVGSMGKAGLSRGGASRSEQGDLPAAAARRAALGGLRGAATAGTRNDPSRLGPVSISRTLPTIALLAMCALMGAVGPAEAGSKAGSGFLEPAVGNFTETVREAWRAPSTAYVGLTLHSLSASADGRLSGLAFGSNAFSLPLPSGSANQGMGLILGMRKSAGNLMLGGEAFLNPPSRRMRSDVTMTVGGGPGIGDPDVVRYTQSSRIGTELGARFLVGYELERSRFFGAAGLATARVNTTVSSDQVGTFGTHQRSMVGSVLAVGMEYDLLSNGTVRLELSRTNHGSFTYGTDGDGRHRVNAAQNRLTIGFLLRGSLTP